MSRYKTLLEKRHAEIEVEIIEAIAAEINSVPSDFAPAKNMQIPDSGLNALIKQYGTDLTSTDETRHLKIDVKKMLAEPQFRGQFGARIAPILDGLLERGARLNGQKITLVIDKDDLRAYCNPPQPSARLPKGSKPGYDPRR